MSKLLFFSIFKTKFSPSQCLKSICTSSSLLRQTIDYSKVPKLNEGDLEEKFTKGSGPGGQNVNKRSNCVFLRHIPSGLLVKIHESRLLDKNRQIAREILTDKLDQHLNGDDSIANQKKRILENKNLKNSAKRKKREEMKAAWKERENQEISGERFENERKLLKTTSSHSPIVQTVRFKSTFDYSKLPKLDENDLEEQIIRGSGTHKDVNCILLKHKPTGIVVKGTKSRLLSENRDIAREIMIRKLDEKLNGEDSIASQKKKMEKSKSSSRESKRKKMDELKTAWKKTQEK